jgi:acetyltransferase
MRFFTPIRSLALSQIARFTQIDYDREMAFVLTVGTEPAILAVVRLAADPDNIRAEFAIVVRSDLKRRGIGRLLMTRLIEYARGRGLEEIFGEVLRENVAMLGLCKEMGLRTEPLPNSPEIARVSLRLH